jgi:nucleoside-diphosphate-sugar epimerase
MTTTTTTTTTTKTKILVTGASGYLGQHFLASLCDHDDTREEGGSGFDSEGGYEVYAVYHQMKGFANAMSEAAAQFQIHSLDLTDAGAVDSYFDTYGPFQVCLHLAALASPAICEKEPEKALVLNVPKHFLHKLIEQDCYIIATSTRSGIRWYQGFTVYRERLHRTTQHVCQNQGPPRGILAKLSRCY